MPGWHGTGVPCRIGKTGAAMNKQGRGFGATLKQFREVQRVSQSKLAERAGFDHSYVSRLESAARTPTREAVEQLASALGLPHVEHDALLAAAGFLPREISSLLSAEPEITQVLDLLQNDAVPEAYRANIRETLRLLAEGWRLALAPAKPSGLNGVAA